MGPKGGILPLYPQIAGFYIHRADCVKTHRALSYNSNTPFTYHVNPTGSFRARPLTKSQSGKA